MRHEALPGWVQSVLEDGADTGVDGSISSLETHWHWGAGQARGDREDFHLPWVWPGVGGGTRVKDPDNGTHVARALEKVAIPL